MTTPVSGSSYLTPDYSKEVTASQMKKGASQGPSAGRGVILAKDSLEVPYEQLGGVHAHEAEAGRPSLPPLFHAHFVEDRQVEDLSRDYYQALRDSLPIPLKEKLEKDEEQENFKERDPDLIALDSSLHFEANLLALTDTVSVPSTGDNHVLIGAQNYLGLPSLVKQQLMEYGSQVLRFLENYLATIDSNDPGVETLTNVSNQIKESLDVMRLNQEEVA